MRDVLVDSNVLVLFLAGKINAGRIGQYCRNNLYGKDDYEYLVTLIGAYDRIVTCPNVLTEVDNLLNGITGDDKYEYLKLTKAIYQSSIEKYIASLQASQNSYFDDLGLADSVVLLMAQECDLLISADSRLCDYAKAFGMKVFDFKEYINSKLYGLV